MSDHQDLPSEAEQPTDSKDSLNKAAPLRSLLNLFAAIGIILILVYWGRPALEKFVSDSKEINAKKKQTEASAMNGGKEASSPVSRDPELQAFGKEVLRQIQAQNPAHITEKTTYTVKHVRRSKKTATVLIALEIQNAEGKSTPHDLILVPDEFERLSCDGSADNLLQFDPPIRIYLSEEVPASEL